MKQKNNTKYGGILKVKTGYVEKGGMQDVINGNNSCRIFKQKDTKIGRNQSNRSRKYVYPHKDREQSRRGKV